MTFMNNILSKSGAVALLVAALSLPIGAKAATVHLNDGDTVDPIALNTTYTFENQTSGNTGPTSFTFKFVADAADTPLPVIASNLTLTGVNGTVFDPFMQWDDGSNVITATFEDIILLGTPIGVGAVLTTLFNAPDRLIQDLTVGWSSFTGDSIQVSLQVNAVPLPAGGLLLISALGGMALLRRRRKAA